MAKYLIVANQTLGNPRLTTQLHALADQDPGVEFTLVVPATPVRDKFLRRGTEEASKAAALKRIAHAKATFAKHGIEITETMVGPASPVDAVAEQMQGGAKFAGVVISTLPRESSQWLKAKVPEVIESQFGVPVYHLSAPASWTIGP